VLAWSAAAALKETPLKIDAIATESFEFIVHPLENFFEVARRESRSSAGIERAINHRICRVSPILSQAQTGCNENVIQY
jgi:hypothetical protein